MRVVRPQSHHPAYDYWTINRLLRGSRDTATGCRVWTGMVNKPGGYGRISYRGRQWRAHRLAYELLLAPIPEGMSLLHRCDNPLCINPNHLRPGTHAENIQEAYDKGRKVSPGGLRHPCRKLTAEQVAHIRISKEPAAAIARQLGLSKSTVARVRTGKTYRNQENPK